MVDSARIEGNRVTKANPKQRRLTLRAKWLIRRIWMDQNYDITQQELADSFRVSMNTIYRILSYRD